MAAGLLRSKIPDLVLPVFLRKLDRKSDWGCDADPVDKRIAHAVETAFRGDLETYSLYRVENDGDIEAVVTGLNSGRSPQNQQIDFLPFRQDELSSSGIRLTGAPGTTKCVLANRLHVDAEFQSKSELEFLCHMAIAAKRMAFRVMKREAQQIVEEMTQAGCVAFRQDSPRCTFARCVT